MKANELRIGNWVKWNYEESSDGNAYPVEYGYELDDIKNNPNIVKPIPLTEEWLEKFGFEQMKLYTGDNCFVKEKFCVLCDGQLKNYDLRLTFDSDQTIRIKLDYVHSLQNLYFALTGEELQTDETKKKVN